MSVNIKQLDGSLKAIAGQAVNIDVIDNLTSDSTTDALSAKQGKVLKGLVDGKADTSSVPTKLSQLEEDINHKTVTNAERGLIHTSYDVHTQKSGVDNDVYSETTWYSAYDATLKCSIKETYFNLKLNADLKSRIPTQTKIDQWDSKANTWYGTTAEYEAQKSQIADGTEVIITDDYISNTQINQIQSQVTTNTGNISTNTSNITSLKESLNKYEQSGFLSRNLLEASLQTTTKNGITCTNNGDGTYTLNGTSSGQTDFSICDYTDFGKATRLVGCPSSASSSTYSIRAYSESDSGTQNFYNNELGNGLALEYTSSNRKYALLIRILPNVTLSNVVLKPMIVDASLYPSATYADYTPYALGNTDLTKDVNDIDASMKMLGWTLPDALKGMNYIDSNGIFHQKIYRVNISDLSINLSGGYYYFVANPSVINADDDVLSNVSCNKIPTIKGADFGTSTLGIAIGTSGSRIYIKDTSVTSVSAFNTKYANTYIYYELATEITKNVDGNEIAPSLKESLANQEAYSTSEVAIGKWIDGKTIYRRVVQATVSSSPYNTGATFSGITDLVSIKGGVLHGGGSRVPTPYYTSANDYAMYYLDINNTLNIVGAGNSVSNNAPHKIIIEYTK